MTAPLPAPREWPIPPPPSRGDERPVRVHIAVAFGNGQSLLVAAATLLTFEMHDAAVMAEVDGNVYDPRTDQPDGIFGSFVVHGGRNDARKPRWLCGVPSPDFCEADIYAARRRMGAWGRELEPLYTDAWPLHTTDDLNSTDLRACAADLGLHLPPDARQRLRALVSKHAPMPPGADRPDGEMKRLERAARDFTLKYDSPVYKRPRRADHVVFAA